MAFRTGDQVTVVEPSDPHFYNGKSIIGPDPFLVGASGTITAITLNTSSEVVAIVDLDNGGEHEFYPEELILTQNVRVPSPVPTGTTGMAGNPGQVGPRGFNPYVQAQTAVRTKPVWANSIADVQERIFKVEWCGVSIQDGFEGFFKTLQEAKEYVENLKILAGTN